MIGRFYLSNVSLWRVSVQRMNNKHDIINNKNNDNKKINQMEIIQKN